MAGSNCEGAAAAQSCSESSCEAMAKNSKSEAVGRDVGATGGMASSRAGGPACPQGCVERAEKISMGVCLHVLS